MRNISVAVLTLLISAPLLAHHGAAALDTGKEITLKGTVTGWIWSNPHCFLQFDAKDDSAGRFYEWASFLPSPDQPMRLFRPMADIRRLFDEP